MLTPVPADHEGGAEASINTDLSETKVDNRVLCAF
jgi:hypothetical protein